jgi:TFIIF-interacting CTD phosphatase-like protein
LVEHYLDPEGVYFKEVLSRLDCRISEAGSGTKYIGDLKRAPDRVVAIDNSIAAFGYDLKNVVPIQSWYGKIDDDELLKCLDIIDAFYSSGLDDVRDFLKRIFGLNARVNSHNIH